MVSTVLGLAVRVYLVSFKRDVSDAIKEAEDEVIDASQKFREQLVIAFEKLRDFQSDVDLAAKATVERVNLQVEALSKNHSERLTGFFAELTTRNQEAFTEALAEVRAASVRLGNSVDGYAKGMRANLTSVEEKVVAFADAVTNRLSTTTFPDDYFSKHLAEPLTQLQSAATNVSGAVSKSSTEIAHTTTVLSAALKKLRDKAVSAEDSLDTVLKLTEQQQAVLDTAQGQLKLIEQLNTTLAGFDDLFTKTLDGINASGKASTELAGRVAAITTEGAEARKSLDRSLADVVSRLGANAQAAEALRAQMGTATHASKQVATQLAENTRSSEAVAGKLAANSAASALVSTKLDGIAAADIETAKSLANIGQQASSAIDRVDTAVEQLQGMLRQLSSLDSALRAQGAELRDVAERIKDVRVTVELPTQPALRTPHPQESTMLLAPFEAGRNGGVPVGGLPHPAAAVTGAGLGGNGASASTHHDPALDLPGAPQVVVSPEAVPAALPPSGT
jgi:hypothetical protein